MGTLSPGFLIPFVAFFFTVPAHFALPGIFDGFTLVVFAPQHKTFNLSNQHGHISERRTIPHISTAIFKAAHVTPHDMLS